MSVYTILTIALLSARASDDITAAQVAAAQAWLGLIERDTHY